jgi:hypothetical protein
MIHLFARPHVLSWLLTVIWFQVLDGSESPEGSRRSQLLWWLPVLMLIWVNLHGGFVMGFVLLGLYIASSAIRYWHCRQQETQRKIAGRLRELGSVTLASLAASLVNPYGYRLHLHVYHYLSSRWIMYHIHKFLSPDFSGITAMLCLDLLITIVVLATWRKSALAQVLVLHSRHSGLYASACRFRPF